jgi:electron transfer flavoprotein alpha subunit
MASVLAVLEQRDGAVRKISHETLTAARLLADAQGPGGTVDAILVGPPGIDAGGLGSYGADQVFVAAAEGLKLYQPQASTAAVVARVGAGNYSGMRSSWT